MDVKKSIFGQRNDESFEIDESVSKFIIIEEDKEFYDI